MSAGVFIFRRTVIAAVCFLCVESQQRSGAGSMLIFSCGYVCLSGGAFLHSLFSLSLEVVFVYVSLKREEAIRRKR